MTDESIETRDRIILHDTLPDGRTLVVRKRFGGMTVVELRQNGLDSPVRPHAAWDYEDTARACYAAGRWRAKGCRLSPPDYDLRLDPYEDNRGKR